MADGEVRQYDGDHVDVESGTEAGAVVREGFYRSDRILYRAVARSQAAIEALQDTERLMLSLFVRSLPGVIAERKKDIELQKRSLAESDRVQVQITASPIPASLLYIPACSSTRKERGRKLLFGHRIVVCST